MEIVNSSSGTLSASRKESTISVSAEGSLPSNYHQDELRIHNRINNTAIGIIIAGIGTILAAFVYMVFTGNMQIGIITTIAGTISEAISGLLFWYVTKASDDKWKYFRTLNAEEEEKRLLKMINEVPNEKFKEKMIEKLVCTYCENRNK
nr:MAG TPA: hypothetical protein [Caudoviricetes sp.]